MYKLYACTNFKGHYPVGTAAIVVARGPNAAIAQLRGVLAAANLSQDEDWKPELKEFKIDQPGAYILRDGDY